jgi:hypothetical protein
MAAAEITDYLSSLGVSAIELLPIHTFIDDSKLLDKGLKNYWGYNTISFFAPARRYAANTDFAFSEFKEMVAHLHEAAVVSYGVKAPNGGRRAGGLAMARRVTAAIASTSAAPRSAI